ncbi:MAG: DsbE family thiol:disulfide interchange protein [Pseudomonadales bacterium]|nr:DsbE family thiol:disulfide interchange protein [Pseudomonadales bacterium]
MNKQLLIPLVIFVVLIVVLALGFTLRDPHLLPSELIDRPFPEFSLNALNEEGRVLSREDLMGEVSIVNVWATWCPNCVIEHPELLRISREEGVRLVGVNYNDDPAKARGWLQRYENPFAFIIVDDLGKLGIDLGVYGAPETFIVDANGVIRYKHVGPVSRMTWEQDFSPVIELLRSGEVASRD